MQKKLRKVLLLEECVKAWDKLDTKGGSMGGLKAIGFALPTPTTLARSPNQPFLTPKTEIILMLASEMLRKWFEHLHEEIEAKIALEERLGLPLAQPCSLSG